MARKTDSLRSSSNLFSDNDSPLNSLFRQAQRLASLQRLVDRHFPAPVRGHMAVASYEDGGLLLVTDSAHRAATLRYREVDLIRALQEERQFHDLNRIRFAIRPDHEPEKRSRSAKLLTDTAARQIASAAKYIGDDQLRKALIRLSRHRSSGE